MTARKPDEVPLLTASYADQIKGYCWKSTNDYGGKKAISMLEAIATGDAVVISRVELEALVSAAQAVIARWDSPLWVQTGHTGEFIARLRTAAKAIAGETK